MYPGKLIVEVLKGANLAAKDPNGRSDPYCVVWTGQKPENPPKTNVMKTTLNPIWNETFELTIRAPILKVRVWDWDQYSKPDFMGKCNVDLTPIINSPFVTTERELNLEKSKKKKKSKVKGTVSIRITYRTDPWQNSSPLTEPRLGYAYILLDNGTPFITGGFGNEANDARNTTEFMDTESLQWRQGPPMALARAYHTMTRLNDGRILVTGGYTLNPMSNFRPTSTCEIYNPKTNQWSEAQRLISPRFRHTATLLKNGHVLVFGGTQATDALSSGEIYNPDTNEWIFEINSDERAFGHTANLLPNGNVIFIGGALNNLPNSTVLFSFLYDCNTNTIRKGPELPNPYLRHTTLTLGNGDIAIFPGTDWYNFTTGNANLTSHNNVKKYDHVKNEFGRMGRISSSSCAVCVFENKILVFGGQTKNAPSQKSNFFELPNNGIVNDFGTSWKILLEPKIGRIGHTAICIPSKGKILLVGGILLPENTVTNIVEVITLTDDLLR
jgi:N-acetylneuraminic acid mutarotase